MAASSVVAVLDPGADAVWGFGFSGPVVRSAYSAFRVDQNDSAETLSQQTPVRPTDWARLRSAATSVSWAEEY